MFAGTTVDASADAVIDVGARDAFVLPNDASHDAGACGTHCSADLHEVLGCHDEVIQTCPPSRGCTPSGTCVSACASAAANVGTVGCDFYSIDPGTDGEADGDCFAAYIANTWNAPVTIRVEYLGTALSLDGMAVIPSGSGDSLSYAPLPGGVLPEGELAILFLNDLTKDVGVDHLYCPTGTKAGVTNVATSSEFTTVMNAFHIMTSAPVAAYDIFPYGGAGAFLTSATLLIPTPAWGKNYMAVDSFAMTRLGFSATAQPFIQIVASQDDTAISLRPSVPIVGAAGVASAAAGDPKIYNLNAGQVLQLKQDAELNGTPIQSNKPIGVWGGNSCMNIGVDDQACDSGHQQLFPISALGSEYAAVRYRPRDPSQPNEAPPWRIMGTVDDTDLSYDPSPPVGAPNRIGSGELILFDAAGPFSVKSQDSEHPFYLSAHMGGYMFGGGSYGTGDPEHVNVIPPQQYLSRYIFMTDPTMGNTNLVLVRGKTTTSEFGDVSLDCLPSPITGWQPVGTGGIYEYAWVDLVVAGNEQGGCGNGYHTIQSTAPFGLTVWGWDQAVSYAYPGGATVRSINSVVVSPMPH
jgi:IgGFc binding protein